MVSRVVYLQEKHGDCVFDASTDEMLYDVCSNIVKGRYEDGYWYEKVDENIDFPVQPVKPDNLEVLSQYLQEAYNEELAIYRKQLRRAQEEQEDQELLKKALVDGQAAYKYLDYRSDYEYERFRVITCAEKYR